MLKQSPLMCLRNLERIKSKALQDKEGAQDPGETS